MSLVNALLSSALSTSLLIVLILLLRRPIARWLGASAAYALWAAVPIQLLTFLVPFRPGTPLVVLPSIKAVSAAPDGSTTWLFTSGVVLAIWAIVASLLLSRLVLDTVRAAHLLRDVRPITGRRMTDSSWLCTSAISSPLVVGLFRPVILIPPRFELLAATEHIQRILRHEQCHVRRRDNLVNLLAHGLLAIFWFTPLAWLGLRAFRADQELSCDQHALADADPVTRARYGRAMVQIAHETNTNPLVSAWTSRHPSIRRRIQMLEYHQISRLRRSVGITLAGLIALASGATATEPEVASTEAETPTAPAVIVRVNPSYPESAATARIEGDVRLGFRINEDGSVDQIEILDSQPENVFDDAAVRAIALWRFEPAQVNGRPVARQAEQTIEFRLD